ncbi:hypothetical protein [Streptomyces sp. NBC_00233]|uniref:hypothetical protein n=1 Tax=Streptomyces sp. NBC_00233 TaxID=2975686 RepID=UPI002253897B|nr:hypothetical protein [Streptomyces sp. NBC_00233]MCX5225744.1 hypothetical protein [Streptomyces sp. NBC_00233]
MSGTENVRRRRSVITASVAAGVLLAGGGGVYLATTASGDGTGAGAAAKAADAAGPPTPLRLEGGSGDATDGGDTRGGPGIAPGEPDPGGGPNGTVYTAKGPLPQGPSSAAVHRPEGLVTSAEVTRLAEALGISGSPSLVGEVWTIRPEKDGSGARLDVARKAPGNWTYSWYDGGPAGDACLKGKACPPPGESKPAPGGTPLSEAAAKAAAAPILKALGQDDAKVTATGVVNGSVRVVNADPVVGGLPTYGWSTGLQIARDGRAVAGSGILKEPAEGATYPVIGAAKALAGLNEDAKDTGPIGVGHCPTAPPGVDGNGKPEDTRTDGKPAPGHVEPTPPCQTIVDMAAPDQVPVTAAVFGLAARDVDGERLLVPSWLFTADPADGAPYTVVRTAVAPEYLAPPAKPSPEPTPPPGDGTRAARAVESVRVQGDGRELAVTFWGGVCSTYTVKADEQPDRVTVRIVEKTDPDRVCIMIAKDFTKTVTLKSPLGDRPVVDAASGEAVPRR